MRALQKVALRRRHTGTHMLTPEDGRVLLAAPTLGCADSRSPDCSSLRLSRQPCPGPSAKVLTFVSHLSVSGLFRDGRRPLPSGVRPWGRSRRRETAQGGSPWGRKRCEPGSPEKAGSVSLRSDTPEKSPGRPVPYRICHHAPEPSREEPVILGERVSRGNAGSKGVEDGAGRTGVGTAQTGDSKGAGGHPE